MRPGVSDWMIQPRSDEAHLPVLTLDGYAAMLLRVKASAAAALSKQLRGDFGSDERLGEGGGGGSGGGGGGGATNIRKAKEKKKKTKTAGYLLVHRVHSVAAARRVSEEAGGWI